MSERKKDFYKLYLVLSLFIISLSAYGDNSECNSCRNRQSQICNQLHSTHNNRNLDSNRLERIQNCIVNACRSVCGTNNNPSSDNQPNQPDFTQESGFSDFNDQTGQRIQNAENLQTSSEMGQLSAGATAKKNSKLQQLGGTVAIVGAGVATYKAGVCFSAQNYPCGALWAGVAISLHKTASNLNEASQKNRDIASQWGTQDDDFSGVDGGYEDIDNTDFTSNDGGTTFDGGSTGNTTGSTGNTTGSTGNTTGSTGNTTGSTGNTTSYTGNTTGSTGNTTGSTGNTTGSTGNTTGSTGNTTGSTGNTTGSTGNTTGSTGNTTGSTNFSNTSGNTDSGDPIPSPDPTLNNNQDASSQDLAFNQELQQWKGAGGGGSSSEQDLKKLLNKHNIKIDPNGNITLPDGKQMNVSQLQTRLSPAQQKAFQAFQNKLKHFGDKMANINSDDSNTKDSNKNFKGYGGGGSKDLATNSGTDSSNMLAGSFGFGGTATSDKKDIGSTVAGMAVQKDGSLIGVRQDNIFDIIHRRYQKKRKKEHFVEKNDQ